MGQVLFIVWRESVEALLVVGILNAWMNQNPAGTAGKRYCGPAWRWACSPPLAWPWLCSPPAA